MAQVRIRPVHEAEVGEVRHRDAAVGRWTLGRRGPEICERDVLAAGDVDVFKKGLRTKAGGEDEGVEILGQRGAAFPRGREGRVGGDDEAGARGV